MIDGAFVEATELMMQIVPRVFTSERLALKGGTAVNLYLDDAPCLSADLDLVFTEIGLPRDAALGMINDEMRRIAAELARDGLDVSSAVAAELGETGLLASNGRVQVTVETNMLLRGTLLPATIMSLSPGAGEWLAREAPARVLSPAEVFAGKFMAALDRQHPRDLYDVRRLYRRGPIDPKILSAFVIYLWATIVRPMKCWTIPNGCWSRTTPGRWSG
jgi:predicted nucleotidyltransferase component of viral defense system